MTNEYLLTAILIFLIGAGNSIFHAEKLRYGKTLFKKVDFDRFEDEDSLHKVTNPIKVILVPLIIFFSYLVIRNNIWLFLFALALNVAPINFITILVSNIIVIPLVILIAKIRKVNI